MSLTRQRAERVRREIIRLCHAGLDSQSLRVAVITQLRKVIPIHVSFFATADPATLLFTGAMSDDLLERVTPHFLENEFLQDDVNKFTWLARNSTPVGTLVQATQGALTHRTRYHDILAPLSLGDKLRAAQLVNGVCWGFLCLHRDQSSPHFTAAEAAFLNQVTPHLALGLRKALLLGSTTGDHVPDEPGVLLLTDVGQAWLSLQRRNGGSWRSPRQMGDASMHYRPLSLLSWRGYMLWSRAFILTPR
jgi:GAF domain-containing protein